MTNIDAERVSDETVRNVRTTHQLAGTVDGRHDMDIRQVVNQQPVGNDLIALHIYSPPLAHMNTFRLQE